MTAIRADTGALLAVELTGTDGNRVDLSVRPSSAALVQVRFDGPSTNRTHIRAPTPCAHCRRCFADNTSARFL